MSGLTVVQTTSNVASAIGAWATFMQTLAAYKNGTASQDDVALAATTFSSAAAALAGSSGFAAAFSQVTGFATSAANLKADLAAYDNALSAGNAGAQNEAIASIMGDTAGIGSGVATAVGAVAQQAGEVGLADLMETIGTASGAVSGVASGLIGLGLQVGDWFQN